MQLRLACCCFLVLEFRSSSGKGFVRGLRFQRMATILDRIKKNN